MRYLVGGLVLLIGSTLAGLVVFLWPTNAEPKPPKPLTAGEVEDFGLREPVHFPDQGVWVVRVEDRTFNAFFDLDPRTVCPLRWPYSFDGEPSFRDPCHGSTYDVQGVRVFGPSGFNLSEFPVRLDGDTVIVEMNGLHCGYRSSQGWSEGETCVANALGVLDWLVQNCPDPHVCPDDPLTKERIEQVHRALERYVEYP